MEGKGLSEEREVTSLVRAATLAENYALTPEGFIRRSQTQPSSGKGATKSPGSLSVDDKGLPFTPGVSGPGDKTGGFVVSNII